MVYQLGDPAAGQGDLTLGMRYRDQVVLDAGPVGVQAAVLDRGVDALTAWQRASSPPGGCG